MSVQRRKFLRASGAVFVAIGSTGCQSLVQLHADIFLYNHTSAAKDISITIWDATGEETQFQKELTIKPINGDKPPIIDDPVERNSDYKVAVRTESGLDETWMWSDVSGELILSIYNDKITYEAATESGNSTE